MQKRIKVLLQDNFSIIAIGVTLVILVLSLVNLNGYHPKSINHLDKLEHALAYCVLAISWLYVFRKKITNNTVKFSIIACCIVFGIIVEVLQANLTSYRTASFLDILANTTGVCIALLIFERISKIISVILE